MIAGPVDPGRLARFAHPRLAILGLLGTGLGLLGLLVFLTAAPVGHGFGTVGVRIVILGALVLAFAASGYVAFFVFERGFE